MSNFFQPESNWWPLIVVLFYIFSLVPTFISRHNSQNSYTTGSNFCQEVPIFLTMGFVISAFALPLVLARSSIVSFLIFWNENLLSWNNTSKKHIFNYYFQIANGAAYLTLGGNLVIFGTMFIFFVLAEQEDGIYGSGL